MFSLFKISDGEGIEENKVEALQKKDQASVYNKQK